MIRIQSGRKNLAIAAGRVAAPEDGASIVELALGSMLLFAMIFGIMLMCLGLYARHATANAARQATRWAMVRGSTSCTNTPNLTDCNASQAEIQSYVANLGYLNISTSNVTVTWLSASATQPTTWSTCASAPCNIPGNEVQVKIRYPLLMNIPFANSQSLTVTGQSQVVISQ